MRAHPLRNYVLRRSEPEARPVHVQGSKNVFNHVSAIGLLGHDEFTMQVDSVPDLHDVSVIGSAATRMGVGFDRHHGSASWTGSVLDPSMAAADAKTFRASICHLVAAGAAHGHAAGHTPGGDRFSTRPIDRHLAVVRAAGGEVDERHDRLFLRYPGGRPQGFAVSSSTDWGPSVGATVSAVLTAAVADGPSQILQPSLEPEVTSVVHVLGRLGVSIGVAPEVIEVEGAGQPLSGTAQFTLPPDRMEAGTLLMVGLVRSRSVALRDISLGDLTLGLLEALDQAGVWIDNDSSGAHGIEARLDEAPRPVDVTTEPHPGFPTDLQPQLAAFATQAAGRSRINEAIYASRVSHIEPLASLGLRISQRGSQQLIHGCQQASGGHARIADIRCGASLLVAAAASPNDVRLTESEPHLDRGYADLAWKLRGLGLAMTRQDRDAMRPTG